MVLGGNNINMLAKEALEFLIRQEFGYHNLGSGRSEKGVVAAAAGLVKFVPSELFGFQFRQVGDRDAIEEVPYSFAIFHPSG